jgi:hypothetical protein
MLNVLRTPEARQIPRAFTTIPRAMQKMPQTKALKKTNYMKSAGIAKTIETTMPIKAVQRMTAWR